MSKIWMGIVVVFMVLLLFSSGCIEALRSGSDTEVLDYDRFETCEAMVLEMLPESIELRNDGGKPWVYFGDQQWKDETLIEYWGVSYKKGEKGGQNPDYYYIDVVSKSFSYSKTYTDPEGRVLGTRSFSIRPVLTPLEETEESFQGKYLGHKVLKFVIVEPHIAECV